MDQITGEFRDGTVSLHGPVDWPDGTPLVIARAADAERVDVLSDYGIDESEWPTTPQGIQELVEWFDGLKPLDLSEEEQAKIEAERLKAKAENIEMMKENWKKVEKLF